MGGFSGSDGDAPSSPERTVAGHGDAVDRYAPSPPEYSDGGERDVLEWFATGRARIPGEVHEQGQEELRVRSPGAYLFVRRYRQPAVK